ncbi:MAG: hypothetical protein E7270_00470 [Lachnospiraceae bacterium]|nr:hypothetical protein [Lachnospiraceae bacterium]
MMIIANGLIVRAEASTIKDEETGYTYSKTGKVTSEFPILRAIVNIENYEASEKNHLTGKTYNGTLGHYLVGGNIYYPIPGVRNTNVLGKNCATMVPQGICRMDNYILITAYDGIPKKSERKFNSEIGNYEVKSSYLTRDAYNSVIYLLTVDGTYITTLVYNKACHMGGITYDGNYVWVAEGKSGVSAISKANILRAAEIATKKKAKSIKLSGIYKINLSKLSKASYCTYFDNKVWFGTFNDKGSGRIYGYSVNYSHGTPVLTPVRYIKAPRYTQGICFYKDNSNVYLAAATSYGRNKNSKIYCYHLKDYYTPTERFNGVLQIIREDPYKTITFPPMIEQISLNGVFLYGIFESGARPYVDGSDDDGKTQYPIGYYCIFDAALIFN